MDTVNDLRQVFLLVQVGQLEYKTLNSLEIWAGGSKIGFYLGKANVTNKIEEVINIVRMSKV